MKRRLSIPIILIIVYSAVFLIFYVIMPYFFNRSYSIGGFFPFFFFFPFVFGRGRRRSNNTYGKSRQQTPDDILSDQYDSKEWEKMKTENYDEYGIRVKSSLSRYWYYAGMVIILVAAVILLVFKGTLLNFI